MFVGSAVRIALYFPEIIVQNCAKGTPKANCEKKRRLHGMAYCTVASYRGLVHLITPEKALEMLTRLPGGAAVENSNKP